MPASPAGLTAIRLEIGLPTDIPVHHSAWSDKLQAFIVTGAVKIDKHARERIAQDTRRRTYDEYLKPY